MKLLRLVLEGSGSASGGSVYQATYSHFQQEALALSKLQHPNTLRIYDFGYLDDSGRPYQISEYLDAGNLEGRVRRQGPLDRDEIERILEPITAAVTEAHQQRIIHRDIKPSNILFGRVGETLVPKLADFGIARSELKKQRRSGDPAPAPDDEDAALSTIALFSPRWAAPEQLCGAPEGPYTDVYALGLLTMFMVSGRPAFDDPDVRGTFNARVRSDDLVLRRLRERLVDGPLTEVLAAAMAANPAKRTASAAELFTAVRGALRPSLPRTIPRSVPPPPARLPSSAPPPPMRRKMDSVTVELETARAPKDEPAVEAFEVEQRVAPAERVESVGEYRVRVVEVNDAIDFTRATPRGEVRFRITMLAMSHSPLRINVKGLNCFVAWADRGGRPTPAIVATQDGSIDLISSTRETVGRISWSFGTPSHIGRVFLVDGQELVIPYENATYAVVVHLGDDRELVAMCKRA